MNDPLYLLPAFLILVFVLWCACNYQHSYMTAECNQERQQRVVSNECVKLVRGRNKARLSKNLVKTETRVRQIGNGYQLSFGEVITNELGVYLEYLLIKDHSCKWLKIVLLKPTDYISYQCDDKIEIVKMEPFYKNEYEALRLDNPIYVSNGTIKTFNNRFKYVESSIMETYLTMVANSNLKGVGIQIAQFQATSTWNDMMRHTTPPEEEYDPPEDGVELPEDGVELPGNRDPSNIGIDPPLIRIPELDEQYKETPCLTLTTEVCSSQYDPIWGCDEKWHDNAGCMNVSWGVHPDDRGFINKRAAVTRVGGKSALTETDIEHYFNDNHTLNAEVELNVTLTPGILGHFQRNKSDQTIVRRDVSSNRHVVISNIDRGLLDKIRSHPNVMVVRIEHNQ